MKVLDLQEDGYGLRLVYLVYRIVLVTCMLTLWTWHWGIIRVVGNHFVFSGVVFVSVKNSDTPTMCMQRSKQKALNVYHIANLLATKKDTQTQQTKNTHTRWFKVTFSSPSWRSLNPLKGSLNHPKKVTLNHQVPTKKSMDHAQSFIPCVIDGKFSGVSKGSGVAK